MNEYAQIWHKEKLSCSEFWEWVYMPWLAMVWENFNVGTLFMPIIMVYVWDFSHFLVIDI